MNKKIMIKAGFAKELKAIKQHKCPICRKKINMEDFKDEVSKIEFMISGICNACQKEFFIQ